MVNPCSSNLGNKPGSGLLCGRGTQPKKAIQHFCCNSASRWQFVSKSRRLRCTACLCGQAKYSVEGTQQKDNNKTINTYIYILYKHGSMRDHLWRISPSCWSLCRWRRATYQHSRIGGAVSELLDTYSGVHGQHGLRHACTIQRWWACTWVCHVLRLSRCICVRSLPLAESCRSFKSINNSTRLYSNSTSHFWFAVWVNSWYPFNIPSISFIKYLVTLVRL